MRTTRWRGGGWVDGWLQPIEGREKGRIGVEGGGISRVLGFIPLGCRHRRRRRRHHRWMLRVAGPRAWGVSSARDLHPEGINLLAICLNVFARVITHDWKYAHFPAIFIFSYNRSLIRSSSSFSPCNSTTSCCELSVKRSRVPFFWTRARKTTRSSLTRDTLQLATTIMLAGIFEGNNVREKSFAIGSSVACVLHFLANVHAVVEPEREDNVSGRVKKKETRLSDVLISAVLVSENTRDHLDRTMLSN